MAEFQRRIVPPHLRSLRNKDTKTTIKSKLDEDDPKELRSTDVQEGGGKVRAEPLTVTQRRKGKRVSTAYPYSQKKSFEGQPKATSGIKKDPSARKITTSQQPVYKRDVKGPKDIKKSQKLSTSGRKTPSPDWGGAFSKWVGGIGDDIGEGVSGAASGATALWNKFAKQFDGETPKSPPASVKKKLNKAVTNARKRVTTSGEPTTKPKVKKKPRAISTFQKEEAPGEGDTPKKVAKKVAKKDISKAEAERRIAAREAQIKRERAAEASKKKKTAATTSKDGRSAKQIKTEDMHEGMSYSPKEETADFKDFLSKHGGVKGFQFNLVGKNKTKAEGMKRARAAYAEEQRDRYTPGGDEKDEYKYGSKRRLVKKKDAGPIQSVKEQMKSIPGQIKATRKIKNKKAQGGTIRLKTGGAVIDTYDYN